MTVAQLIEKLREMPQDMPVLIERGDWGPCTVKRDPRRTVVDMRNGSEMLWEVLFPESGEPDEDEIRSEAVVL